MAFQVVDGLFGHPVHGGQCHPGADDFVHHADGKRARADGQIADGDGGKELIEPLGVAADGFRQPFVGVPLGFRGLKVGEAFRQPQKQREVGRGDVRGAGGQVKQQCLLAHVVDDDARGVIRAAGVPDVFREQVLKHQTQHFGINGDFLFQRFGFVDGEIVAVKHIKNSRAGVPGVIFPGI